MVVTFSGACHGKNYGKSSQAIVVLGCVSFQEVLAWVVTNGIRCDLNSIVLWLQDPCKISEVSRGSDRSGDFPPMHLAQGEKSEVERE